MKRNLLIALSIILMLFAFTACSNDNSSKLDQTEAADIAEKINPVELMNDALAGKIDGAKVTFKQTKAAATFIATVEFTNASYNGLTISSGRLSFTLTGEYTGTSFSATSYRVTTEQELRVVDEGADTTTVAVAIEISETTTASTGSTVSVMVDTSSVDEEGNIEDFTVTKVSISIPETGAQITVGGNDVTEEVPSAPVEDTPDEPVVNNWPISVRIGAHVNHPANKAAEADYKNGTITVTTALSELDSYLSDNATEAEKGKSKWIALLISVDGVDIKTVSYGVQPIDEAAVTEANGAGGNGDEFVLWIRAEQVLNEPKEFKLSREGVDPITVTVNVVDKGSGSNPTTLTVTNGEELVSAIEKASTTEATTINVNSDAGIQLPAGTASLSLPAGSDITLNLSEGTVIKSNDDATGDLGTESTDYLFIVPSGASLTITGSGRIGGTLNDNPSAGIVKVEAGGKLHVVSGDMISFPNTGVFMIDNHGTATIEGGNFYSTYGTIKSYAGSTLSISGGKFVSCSSYQLDIDPYSYSVYSSGSLTITNGEIYGIHGGLAICGGTATISGTRDNLKVHAMTDIWSEFGSYTDDFFDYFYAHNNMATTVKSSFHGVYCAGEDTEVTDVKISGGEFKSSIGYGLYVGNTVEGDGGNRKGAKVSVSGGTFTGGWVDVKVDYVEGGQGNGTLILTGGGFLRDTPETLQQYCAEGYVATSSGGSGCIIEKSE